MGIKPSSRREGLLIELCSTYGWCFPAEGNSELLAIDGDVVAIVDSILTAAGKEPSYTAKATRRWLADLVDKWVDLEVGKG